MANTIERSVRRALEKGDASDPAFRLKVYEAAERAINRNEADGKLTSEASDDRRRDLIAAVEAIEADHPYLPEGEVGAGEGDVARPQDPPTMREEGVEGGVENAGPPLAEEIDETGHSSDDDAPPAAAALRPAAEPLKKNTAGTTDRPDNLPHKDRKGGRGHSADEEREAWSPGGRRAGSPDKRRWIVAAVIAILVVFLLAVGGYLVSSFLFGSYDSGERSDPIADAIQSSGTPGATAEDWITAFSGTELSGLDEASQESGELVTGTGGRAAVRVHPEVGTGTTIVLTPETLSSLSPGAVRGELTVGSPDGKRREFSVECLLDGQSVCGRQRFSTTVGLETFVFDLTLPVDANAAGELVVDPTIGGAEADLDLYGFRLRNP